MKKRSLLFYIFLFPFLLALGQGYHLEVGEKYQLSQSYTQNTFLEASNIQGNVSLDIRSSVTFEIKGVIDSLGYEFECQYDDLSLSLFSPDMGIAISSEIKSSDLIIKYFSLLEDQIFNVVLAFNGELISVSHLDEHILNLYNHKEDSYNEQDIIIKTMKEAYGEDAFIGFMNLTLNMYCMSQESRCRKSVAYSFNAKPIILHNTIYMQAPKDEHIRIQGIGTIEANEEDLSFEGGSISTKLNGSQTFDHLFDAKTGWMIEGNSKQKIYLSSVFHGSNELPEGLEIPSVTETEYEFRGRKIELED